VTPYRLTAAATAQLQDIYDYIAAHDGPNRADRVLDTFRAALQRLGGMPNIGHRHPDVTDPNARVWTVYSWHIVYDPTTRPIASTAPIARVCMRTSEGPYLGGLRMARAGRRIPSLFPVRYNGRITTGGEFQWKL
jgi:antitoxin ParD1/3/4/toxin ParE1/3/4